MIVTVESSSSGASSLEKKARQWRKDAYFKILYGTAVLWGNKVMTMTGDLNDVLWLAQVHYNMGQYVSAQKLIWNLIDSSAIKMEKYQEVLNILDDENPFLDRDYNSVDKNTEGGINLEASICYLRGVAYSQQSDLDNAKQGTFVNSLKFDEQLEYEEAYFIKMNYISMPKKYEHVIESQEARSELENKFRLLNNAGILLSHADELYTQC
ncbi:hypothetical protein C2G38_2191236 [Gigaspora rosea]|uniref:Uncharacterized protein n=1 Tax=Gigaspora rosea TaxID=44941 RepID=A0A397V9I3_9GLOM|nr:hypothetical protein C2G38_2191236 [Gigaspora rosea]